MWHEHIKCSNTTNITEHGEEECVPASLSMENSEFLTIGEKFHIFLDIVSSFEANVKTELLLSLQKLVDIVQGASLLLTEHNALVIAGCQTLGPLLKWVHVHF